MSQCFPGLWHLSLECNRRIHVSIPGAFDLGINNGSRHICTWTIVFSHRWCLLNPLLAFERSSVLTTTTSFLRWARLWRLDEAANIWCKGRGRDNWCKRWKEIWVRIVGAHQEIPRKTSSGGWLQILVSVVVSSSDWLGTLSIVARRKKTAGQSVKCEVGYLGAKVEQNNSHEVECSSALSWGLGACSLKLKLTSRNYGWWGLREPETSRYGIVIRKSVRFYLEVRRRLHPDDSLWVGQQRQAFCNIAWCKPWEKSGRIMSFQLLRRRDARYGADRGLRVSRQRNFYQQ